jgi:tetratricopeptide (TPR) repeat protein
MDHRNRRLNVLRPLSFACALAFVCASSFADDVAKFIEQLNDANEELREHACKALGALGDPQAVPALEKKLRDSSPTVQSEAADALVKIGGAEVEAIFRKLCESGNSDFRQVGYIGLAKVSSAESTAELLISKLSDTSSRARWSAAFALGFYGDARAIEPLKKLADSDANEEVREVTAESVLKLQSNIRWRRDLDAVHKELRDGKTPAKPLFIYFTSRRSDWCANFEDSVLSDSEVVDAAEKFICVRVEVEGKADLIAKYEIKGVPTIVLTDAARVELGRLVGAKKKDDVMQLMADGTRPRSSFRETRRKALDNPKDAESNWRTAEVYLAEDRLSLAAHHLKAIVENDPKNQRGYTANALFALGYTQGKLEQHTQALATLERYLKEYPAHKDNDRAKYCMALSQLATGKKNEARQTLETLIQISPESPIIPAAKIILDKINGKN